MGWLTANKSRVHFGTFRLALHFFSDSDFAREPAGTMSFQRLYGISSINKACWKLEIGVVFGFRAWIPDGRV